MKILIYGSNGWIGSLFKKYLDLIKIAEVVEGTERLDSDTLIDEIVRVYPTHVISFTGRTHGSIGDQLINSIDYLEYPDKLVENIRDNLYSPVVLADICNSHSIHYTYLGTGCIFDGPVDQLFTEDSLPNYFGSSYSIVKGFTDRLMQDRDVLNLRIRMPISSIKNDRNFITKIVKYDKICSIFSIGIYWFGSNFFCRS
jgi:dTDP-4-dehydrorhamnose reductase